MAKLQLKLRFLLYYRKLRYESLFVQTTCGKLENRKKTIINYYDYEIKDFEQWRGKNVDATIDMTLILQTINWKHFLSDSRYSINAKSAHDTGAFWLSYTQIIALYVGSAISSRSKS